MSTAYDLNELSGLRPRSTQARCMNPECQQTCTFEPGAGGRTQLFCSPKCRVAFGAQRRQLIAELAVVEAALTNPEVSHVKRRQIVKVQTHLKWLLERYPSDRV